MFMKQEINNNSIGVVGLLYVLFIALKLMAVIDWSWFIIVCWPVGLWLGIIAFVLLGAYGSYLALNSKGKGLTS